MATNTILGLGVGLFNAALGKNYLSDLANAENGGMSLLQIADFLDGIPQFTIDVMGGKTPEQQVDQFLSHYGITTGAAQTTAKTFVNNMLSSGKGFGAIAVAANDYLLGSGVAADFQPAAALLKNKIAVATAFSKTYSSESVSTLQGVLAGVTGEMDTADEIEAYLTSIGFPPGVLLTAGTDIVSGHIFVAPKGFTPGGTDQVNTLNDDDRLTGTSATNDRLEFDYVLDADTTDYDIVPIIQDVETINVKYALNVSSTLDLQDSNGALDINLSRIDDGVVATVENITEATTNNLSINDSQAPTSSVNLTYLASALVGSEDAVTLKLNNAQVNHVHVEENNAIPTQGFESFLLKSEGAANSVTTLYAEDVKSLKIEGDKDLNLGGTTAVHGAQGVEATHYIAGLDHVAGSLTEVNAEQLTGKLSYTIGDEINAGLDDTSGVAVNLKVTGGKSDDTFRLAPGASIESGDAITGGEGVNTLFHFGGTSTIEGTANVKGIKGIEIRTGHDDADVADDVTIDANAFDALETILIRNEGQLFDLNNPLDDTDDRWESVSEVANVELKNLNETQAMGITVAHGTTGNSNLVNNTFTIGYAEGAADDTATSIRIIDGINADPVFNMQLTLKSAELITIVDDDTESNTVHLLDRDGAEAAGSTLTVLQGVAPAGGAADPDKGKYMNFDRPDGVIAGGIQFVPDAAGNDYVARGGYGHTTDGLSLDNSKLFNNTTHLDRESAEQVALGNARIRDTEVDRVFYGIEGVAGDEVIRQVFDNVVADGYAGDVEIRLNEITRADGVSSMNIKTGSGNDTFIFDAIGVTSAGFTSGDTISGGEGKDTLIIDGNTATIPGTPRIDHQTSEWDNLSGIDVLRFGNNAGVANGGVRVANTAGAYYARIDNDFVAQSDIGNRLTVINNDGDLENNSESDLVLDLRGLDQGSWVTFQGANANGASGDLSSNRLVVDDISANQNMILDGGDTDVRDSDTVGYVAGNNNVYEVRNKANVSISDLSQTSNFGLIEFTNDQAVPQVLELFLNNTIVEALVDSSRTATDAATQEVLDIVAIDNGAVASTINLDARQLTGFHSVDVTGSAGGNDILNLNANIGGSTSTADLGASTGDRVNWTGGAATTVVSIELGAWVDGDADNSADAGEGGVAIFQLGAVTTGHIASNVEIVDLSGLTYQASTVAGTAADETFVSGSGIDSFTGGGGANTFIFGVDADADSITDFVSGADFLEFGGAAGTVANFNGGLAALDFAGAIAAAEAVFNGTVIYAEVTVGADQYVIYDKGGDGNADAAVLLVGAPGVVAADII